MGADGSQTPADPTGDTESPDSDAVEPTLTRGGAFAAPATPPQDAEWGVRKASLRARMFGAISEAPKVGRYAILRVLGEGGMGTVYACYDDQLDRRVALKLVKGASTDAARKRMLREAQAMAKLSHPNVVPVFEVGEHEGLLFVAMEFVQGTTLGDWCDEAERDWRDKLHKYMEAGRGLVAAHEAGLIHRDFKPGNAMVGEDGRVRVLDFGLAARFGLTEEDAEPPAEKETAREAAFDLPLTETGAVMGTPAYMSPEQFRGERVGAASDQFSWCVALWETLFGERPFQAPTMGAMLETIERGPPTVVEPRGFVAPLRAAIARGLKPDPAERWPSLQALLTELGRLDVDPEAVRRVRRRRWGVGIGSAVVFGGLWFGQVQLERHRVAACEDEARSAIGAIWDDGTRTAVGEAMLATDSPIAQTTADKATARIDRYAESWEQARADACIETEARQTQTPEHYARALRCLERRSMRLDGVVASLREADASMVDKAVSAVAGLDPVAPCRDPRWLDRMPDAPTDADPAVVRSVASALAGASALGSVGRYPEALEQAQAALEQAQSVGDPPLLAEAKLRVGSLLDSSGKADDALPLLQDAFFEARRAGDLATSYLAAQELALVVGYRKSEFESGLVWARHAEAALDALDVDGDHPWAADRYSTVAQIQQDKGDFTAARDNYQRAVEIGEATLGEAHPSTATSLLGLSLVLEKLGEYDAAKSAGQRALAIQTAALGEEHPLVGYTLTGLGDVATAMAQYDEALASYERALALREATVGPDHPLVAYTLGQMANALVQMHALDRARAAYERSIEVFERTQGPKAPIVASSLVGLGAVLSEQGDHTAARQAWARARTIQEEAMGPDHPYLAFTLANLAHSHADQGADFDQAIAFAERALAIRQKALGDDHPLTAISWVDLAEIQVQAGAKETARGNAEAALDRLDALGDAAGDPGVRFRAARAFVAAGGPPARAVAAARAALASIDAQAGRAEDVAEVQAWIREHVTDDAVTP